jgi:hypothetical protein|tara:strand:- start:484 stop:585 length:102 start_codon:yes stop_codon:yes gene_type:complete
LTVDSRSKSERAALGQRVGALIVIPAENLKESV